MAAPEHRAVMDNVYRYQRHIYDVSRKYYLLGRDRLIADLDPPPGGSVLEIGCGTGRNLVSVGRKWPNVELFGVDISPVMLETAQRAVSGNGLAGRTMLAEGDACGFDAAALFGRAQFDRVFISYALSMIPDWQAALTQAASCVAPGGRLSFVDFGQQDRLPALWKQALFGWLGKFHVEPRADLAPALATLANQTGSAGHVRSLYRGYAIMGGIARQ
jgi:S-adenosylmethionine-diacylgycerolhomoserine-N-methlytransferase